MTSNTSQEVNYIGIGVSRSGSTWLSRCLAEHPDVYMPEKKELHFFDSESNYAKGIDFYMHQYVDAPPRTVMGEFTPSYVYKKSTLERIHKHFPNAKLILVLRDPLERALSQYHQKKSKLFERAKSFPEALTGPHNHLYLDRGCYGTHLNHVYSVFPEKSQLLILQYEDIRDDPYTVAKSLYTFLGVDASYKPQCAEVVVNTTYQSTEHVQGVNNILFCLKDFLYKSSVGTCVIRNAKKLHFDNLFSRIVCHNRKFSTTPQQKEVIDEETRTFLKKYFSTEIKELRTSTGLPFSKWSV